MSLLEDETVSLLAFIGSDFLEPRLRPALKNKVIYHIGEKADLDANLSGTEIKAYLGYGRAPTFIINAPEENLFRDASMAGLVALFQGGTLSIALEETRKAWGDSIEIAPGLVIPIPWSIK